jgi:hypothetical protein
MNFTNLFIQGKSKNKGSYEGILWRRSDFAGNLSEHYPCLYPVFITKKIVEAHHGRLKILDNTEKGVTFRVRIPISMKQ